MSEKIIDQIGALAAEIKALTANRKTLIESLDHLPAGSHPGFVFAATIVEKIDWRLDTKGVKAEMGDDWYNKRCKQVPSRAFRTTAL